VDIKLSDRVNAIKPSPTLAVTNKAAELSAAGQDIIGLGAGEPDFDTPEHIKEAAIQAIKDGKTKYTAVDGTPELKQAIIDKFARDNGFNYGPKQILVSCGGKQSFFNLSLALLNPGDEVIIPAPYWVSYPDMVKIAEGVPVIIPTGDKENFKINADQLREAITDKTRLLVLNSPSNPSGAAYTKQELNELALVLLEYPNVLVATDDMYEHILWTEEPFCNILNACPALESRCIVLNGVSKAYSMTGWRIGYAAGPEKLIGAMKKIQSQSTSNPTSISQAASVAALNGSQDDVATMLKAFKERHDYVHGRLNQIKGISCNTSDGTFYAFPNMSELIANTEGVNNDVEFAEHVIQKAKLAIVPGSAFGCEGYARLSYATSLEVLEDALNRLESIV
jgi:aspartate aminotransferase